MLCEKIERVGMGKYSISRSFSFGEHYRSHILQLMESMKKVLMRYAR